MGGQFWSAYISCDAQFADAVQLFMEQVDIIKQMVAKYPNDLKWAVSSSDIGKYNLNEGLRRWPQFK